MSGHTRNIRGGSNLVINISDVDINLTNANTVTANVVTSMGAVFSNGTINLLDKINTKQNTIDSSTNITCNDIICNDINISGTDISDSLSGKQDLITTSTDISMNDLECSYLTVSDINLKNLLMNTKTSYDDRLSFFHSPPSGTGNSGIWIMPDGMTYDKEKNDSEGITLSHNSNKNGIIQLTSFDASGTSDILFSALGANQQGGIRHDFDNDRMDIWTGARKSTTACDISCRNSSTYFRQTCQFEGGVNIVSGSPISYFNEPIISRADVSYQEINGGSYAMFVDVSANQVAIGHNTPTCALDINGNVLCDDITCDNILLNDDITCNNAIINSDLTVETDLLFCDSTNNRIGIGINAPQSGFHLSTIQIESDPTSDGIHMGRNSSSSNYQIDLAVTNTASAKLSFSNTVTESERGKILYSMGTDEMHLYAAGDLQMEIKSYAIDCQDNDIISNGALEITDITATGSITCNSLNVDSHTLFVDSTNNRVGINIDILGGDEVQEALQVNGNIQTGSKIIISRDESVASSPATFRRYELDVNSGSALEFKAVDNGSAIDDIRMELNNQGDLTLLNGDLILSSGNVGIGTSTPESALQITGARQTTPATYGIHFGSGGGNNYGMEIVSGVTGDSLIDFTEPGQNRRGRILYDNNAEEFKFGINNNGYGIVMSDGEVDLTTYDLTTTGNVDANLNSTRGQLLSFMGENGSYTAFSSGDYIYKYGDRALSNSTYGIMIPGNFKMKRWCYACSAGSILTTNTKLVFDIVMNGSVVCYCIVDFSLSTASITEFKATGKYSSSATSQVDIDYERTGPAYGTNISYRVNSNTNKDGFNFSDHRMSTFIETTENW